VDCPTIMWVIEVFSDEKFSWLYQNFDVVNTHLQDHWLIIPRKRAARGSSFLTDFTGKTNLLF